MKKSPYSRRSALSVLSVLLITFVIIILLSSMVQAELFPKLVRGWVKDSVGNELAGASVTVNIRRASDDSIRATLTDDTDANGFYSVTFDGSQWDINDRIEVISSYVGHQESNSTLANANAIQYINVTYPYEIPQLSGALGFAVAGGAIGLVAVAVIVFKKRRPSQT